MAYYSWQDDAIVDSIEPRIYTISDESVSPMNGDIQTIGLPGTRWGWTINLPESTWTERAGVWGSLVRLNGREHRIKLWDLVRPVPVGTIPLTGVTLNAPVDQFATSASLATGVPYCTIRKGDWFTLGPGDTDQLVVCVVNEQANSAGVINVEFRHMARRAYAAGSVVVTNKPKALYVLREPNLNGGAIKGASIAAPWSFDLIEVFQ